MSDDRYTITLDTEMSKAVKEIVKKTGESKAEVTRRLIRYGLASSWMNDNRDEISVLVRENMNLVLVPQMERMIALLMKSGLIGATGTFLNVQALQSLVPDEKKKDVIKYYNSARKKSVEFYRKPLAEINDEITQLPNDDIEKSQSDAPNRPVSDFSERSEENYE